MGDPLSPALCIATLAWREHFWFADLDPELQKRCTFTRYMDDVYLLANTHSWADGSWDSLLSDYEQHCYSSCLKVERTPDDTFLESVVHVSPTDVQLGYYNKNQTQVDSSKLQVFLRHQNAHSFIAPAHKASGVIGAFIRIQRNSTDPFLMHGLCTKTRELINLGYRPKFIGRTLKYVHTKLSNDELLTLADTLLHG